MPPQVSTETVHHQFESKLIERLEDVGFLVASATYHDVQGDVVREALQRNYSPTSLYIRLRADRIVISSDAVFELEVKTNESEKHRNMALEALQLMQHIQALPLGVDCLYAYHDPGAFPLLYKGFWVSALPKISRFRVPENTRYNQDAQQIVRTVGPHLFGYDGEVDTRPIGKKGSRDPFVIISEKDVQQMEDLGKILDRLEETLNTGGPGQNRQPDGSN